MRVVLQRVSSASVAIAGQVKGRIERGLLLYVGIESDDDESDGEWLTRKIVSLRVFADEVAPMNRSLPDVAGDILLISQFTLHASIQKGARPSFHLAARPELARPQYDRFIEQLSHALGRPIATGEFGAEMQVAAVNEGPVTLILDSKRRE